MDAIQKQHFLIVENDPNDAFLIRRAFTSVPQCGTSFVCRNPSEAKAYLSGAGMYQDRGKYPRPGLILSDFRMPGETGVELIRWIKGRPELSSVPVIMLTGSASPADMAAARDSKAAEVLRKPSRLEDLQKLLVDLAKRWCVGSSGQSV